MSSPRKRRNEPDAPAGQVDDIDDQPVTASGRSRAQGRLPTPMDPAAEAALIAAVMTDPACFDDVFETVDEDDFSLKTHAATWAAICSCDNQGRPLDVVNVADELRRQGQLPDIDHHQLLADILANVAGLAAGSYAEIIAEHSTLRKLLHAAREIATSATADNADASQVLESAEEQIFAIGATRNKSGFTTLSQGVNDVLALIARSSSGDMLGISTGFKGLDELTGGFQPGQLITLAARPAMGKSSLGLQIARHVAATTGEIVPFLSYEMSVQELVLRILSTDTGISSRKLASGDLPAGSERRLTEAAEDLLKLDLLFDDQPPESIVGARSALRRLARKGPIALVVVDYLQLMSGDPRRRDDSRANEVAQISRGLKRLARELDAPVLALSQLNRQVEQRPNKRPVLSDLRDSGSVEQDSDVVAFLYRDVVYDASADPTAAELIIAKQRAGGLGTIHLTFEGTTTRFADRNGPAPAGPAPVAPIGAPRGGGRYQDPF